MSRRLFRAVPPLALHLALAAGGLAITGCGGDDGGSGIDAGLSPSCQEALTRSDLAFIQQRIFQPSCANFSDCHQGRATDAAGLNLEEGQSRANLVDVDSTLFPQFKLVAPGRPRESYLLIILGHYPDLMQFIDPDSGPMPYNSPLLCQPKREAIERWIMAGAPSGDNLDGGVPDANPAAAR